MFQETLMKYIHSRRSIQLSEEQEKLLKNLNEYTKEYKIDGADAVDLYYHVLKGIVPLIWEEIDYCVYRDMDVTLYATPPVKTDPPIKFIVYRDWLNKYLRANRIPENDFEHLTQDQIDAVYIAARKQKTKSKFSQIPNCR